MNSVNFDKLVGLSGNLYYNNKLNTFQLGDVEFEVMEDEEDGYRSSMREVQIINKSAPRLAGGYLGTVLIIREDENSGNFDGYSLIDTIDHHAWITFGTDHSDIYYPCFVFKFNPRY